MLVTHDWWSKLHKRKDSGFIFHNFSRWFSPRVCNLPNVNSCCDGNFTEILRDYRIRKTWNRNSIIDKIEQQAQFMSNVKERPMEALDIFQNLKFGFGSLFSSPWKKFHRMIMSVHTLLVVANKGCYLLHQYAEKSHLRPNKTKKHV